VLPSAMGPSSTCRPGRVLEWATLPLNSRSGRLRGRSGAPVERPVGEAGSANQNPKPVDPAATLPLKLLSGLVIQNVAARLSVGSTPSVVALVPSPRLLAIRFPVSAPSSRK
jgi:hypothetical protein